MQRFAMERHIMVARRRLDWRDHGNDFKGCACEHGIGIFRKRHPRGSHPRSSCRICSYEYDLHRQDVRRERYAAKAVIREELDMTF